MEKENGPTVILLTQATETVINAVLPSIKLMAKNIKAILSKCVEKLDLLAAASSGRKQLKLLLPLYAN